MRDYPLTVHVKSVWLMDNGNVGVALRYPPQLRMLSIGETFSTPITPWQRFKEWISYGFRTPPPLRILFKDEVNATIEIGFDHE